MKTYEFVSKSELKSFALWAFCFLIFLLVVSVILFQMADLWTCISTILLLVIFFSLLFYIDYHSLISQYKITKDGISNRILFLNWNNITQCVLFYPEKKLKTGQTKEYPPMICMGDVKNGTIFSQNPRQCVIVPLTQRNLKLIDKYWKTKSIEMQNIIEQNIGFPDQPDNWLLNQ